MKDLFRVHMQGGETDAQAAQIHRRSDQRSRGSEVQADARRHLLRVFDTVGVLPLAGETKNGERPLRRQPETGVGLKAFENVLGTIIPPKEGMHKCK